MERLLPSGVRTVYTLATVAHLAQCIGVQLRYGDAPRAIRSLAELRRLVDSLTDAAMVDAAELNGSGLCVPGTIVTEARNAVRES